MQIPISAHAADLATAITHRRPIRMTYMKDPQSQGVRLVHPHALFESTPGTICMHAVQVAGPSSSGRDSELGWRQFDLAYVRDVEILEGRFEVDPGFNPRSDFYRRLLVDCEGGWAGGTAGG